MHIKGHLLTPEQKRIKQELMERLVDGFYPHLYANRELFDDQAFVDCIISCLIMFSRDLLARLLQAFDPPLNEHAQAAYLDELLHVIRAEALKTLRSSKETQH